MAISLLPQSAVLSAAGTPASSQLAAPVILILEQAAADKVELQWSDVPGASSYNIYRSPFGKNSYTKIGSTNWTIFYDQNLTYGKYTYIVSAVNGSTEGKKSEPSTVELVKKQPFKPGKGVDTEYIGDKELTYTYKVDQLDSDKDGLTDYEEVNKYLTDPSKKDSDNDGKPDGDWEERKEFTYTLSAVREILAPYNTSSLNDTFEDIRVILETDEKLVYEAVFYPYAKDVVTGSKDWKKYSQDPAFQELLKPRKTTNWDSEMQQEILSAIPDNCETDLDVAKFITEWFMDRQEINIPIRPFASDPLASHCPIQYFLDLRGDKPVINNKTEWEKDKLDKDATDEDFIDQIIYAKRIFDEKYRGSCTPMASTLATVLRAAGIPTRIIATNALYGTIDHDGTPDSRQLLGKLKNADIKNKLLNIAQNTYYGHVYLESYIGGRWIKINYNTLPSSTYIDEPGYPVLLPKRNTFYDLAETTEFQLWSKVDHEEDYKLISVSDNYGKHSKLQPSKDNASNNDYSNITAKEVPDNTPNKTDTDGDGLSDYHEKYKYFTNPLKKDSDGDGKPDGDWKERREYTYSIREILKLTRPWDTSVMRDDYQDVRIIEESKDYITLEVVYYPYNKNKDAITENKNWKTTNKLMADYLKPGITSNWDTELKALLIKDLKAAGIDVDKLSDKELVPQAANWLLNTSSTIDGMPPDFFVYYPKGKPEIFPELKDAFESAKFDSKASAQTIFETDILGKQMYINKKHGTCGSTSIYLTTAFKALGIPVRTISTVPAFDGNDDIQYAMINENIKNPQVREDILAGSVKGFANHFYNEVYVGNRWVRLNYSRFGANIYDRDYFGLQFHNATIKDYSDFPLAETWGMRLAGRKTGDMSSNNPYQMLYISDEYGINSSYKPPTDNKAPSPASMEIQGAIWENSFEFAANRPDNFLQLNVGRDIPEEKLKSFIEKAPREVILKAPGCTDIHAYSTGFYTLGECAFYFGIPAAEYNNMKPNTAYKIYAVNGDNPIRWKASKDITITKPKKTSYNVDGIISSYQHKDVHITAAYWKGSADMPDSFINRSMRDEDHIFLKIQEWIIGQDHTQLINFEAQAGTKFILKAPGSPDIHCSFSTPYALKMSAGDGSWRGFCLTVDANDLPQMKKGVKYTIHPVNISDTYKWIVSDKVTVTRQ